MIGCIYKLLKRIELKALSNRLISAGGVKLMSSARFITMHVN